VSLPVASSVQSTTQSVQLWFDPLSNTDAWQLSAPQRVSIQTSGEFCTSGDCVRISGYRRTDTSMTRGTANEYLSYTLKFDVAMNSMEAGDYCEVYVRFGENGNWQELASYQGNSGRRRYRENGIQFANTDTTANMMYVKLATNGGSRHGRDYCYYDNVDLYGTGRISTSTARSNAIVAGKQALMPFAVDRRGPAMPDNASMYDKFFSIGSTPNTLLWIGALTVSWVAYIVFVWHHRQKQQANVNETVSDAEQEYNDQISPLQENV